MIGPPDDFACEFRQLQRTLDGLVAVAVEYLMLAAAGDSSEYEITPQIFAVATAVVQLFEAVEAERGLLYEHEDQNRRDVSPELEAARTVTRQAVDRYLSALSNGIFAPGGLGARYTSNVRPSLRRAAELANIVLDKKARQVAGVPSNKEYRRDLERAEDRYYTFVDALLVVLALDAVCAAAESVPDISEAAHALVSGIGELSRVIENERALFEANGIEPPLLDLRARRRDLQDKIGDNLRAFAGNYPTRLPKMRDRRAEDLLASALDRDARRLGVIVFNTMIDRASPELLHAYDADQIKYARGLHS